MNKDKNIKELQVSSKLESSLVENRVFQADQQFKDQANLSLEAYESMHKAADKDPESFWAGEARNIVWQKNWDRVLEWDPPYAKWFNGGKLNITDSCLKRHAINTPDKTAIVWESEINNQIRKITYQELYTQVLAFAQKLKDLNVEPGDRVAIYMPLVPEITTAMLACAHIGAVHTVVFGGFSAESLRDRINDCECKLVITAKHGTRKGKKLELNKIVEQALNNNACPSIENVFLVPEKGLAPKESRSRSRIFSDENFGMTTPGSTQSFDAEHPLFILYTSGTTGKPKGLIHTTGGYLTQTTASFKWVFDHKPDDVYWCSADAGWITGHSYLVYGPLSNGATIFMYEGAPTYPKADRFWEMIARHKVSVFYTAPTAIRTFMRLGDENILKHDLSSLRLLGTVGEPINPEAWIWYHKIVGKEKCPIVDTWWQTETGSIMISPIPGPIDTTPGTATRPLFGISPAILDENGFSCEADQGGYLVIKKPWPSMARGIWGDAQRFYETYWAKFRNFYFTGDSARKDKSGNYWLMGRVDDVVNISGHRIGTMEVESALVAHDKVAEAAVVARPDDITGEAIVAFVTPKANIKTNDDLKIELLNRVSLDIGKFARPSEIRFTNALPKTRSGKIMRRLLRELATSGKVKGDTTTLEDFSAIAALQ